MKRILAAILLVSMLLSMVACGAQSAETKTAEETKTEEKKTEGKKEDEKKTEEAKTEEKTEVVYAKVNDPLTWDKINAIPVANSSMTTDELRQICIDLISLQVSFPWVPEETLTYRVDRHGVDVTLEEGVLRGGIPYVNIASGNVYRIMRYYDSETGHLDISQLGIDKNRFGTACSGSAAWGWTRVVNSARISWTGNMTPANGFIPVGPYETVAADVNRFGGDDGETENTAAADVPDCKDIAQKNGEQKMFESYALMKKADGLVNNGHVTMSSQDPVVVRNADGTINGEESYLHWCEQGLYQTGASHTRTQEDGTNYQIQGNVHLKRTFASLYKDGYLPFTFAEFLGTDPVEKAEVYFTDENGNRTEGTNLSASAIQVLRATCNYPMSDVNTVVKDAEGKVVLDYYKASANHYSRSWSMKEAFPAPAMAQFAAKGGHSFEIYIRVSTGENLLLYSGPVIA